MNGDDVRNMTFVRRWRAYDPAQVDQLLARVAEELDAGRAALPLIECAGFTVVTYGYDRQAVDAFLAQIRLQESECEPASMSTDPWRDLAVWNSVTGRAGKDVAVDCTAAWRGFAQVPGTRLTWMRTEAKRRELRTDDRQTLVSFRHGRFTDDRQTDVSFRHGLFRVSGRTFQIREVGKADWPGVAQAFSLSPISRDPLGSQVVDAAGLPILYIGGRHFDRSADAYIKFSDQCLLRFPVRGTGPRNAIMTAVDQAGNKVARYRRLSARPWWDVTGTVEIMVHPGQRLIDDLALAIALAAPWLGQYFHRRGGGG